MEELKKLKSQQKDSKTKSKTDDKQKSLVDALKVTPKAPLTEDKAANG